MGGTGTLWRPIAAGLENEFEILAPDQRGHGASRRAGLKDFSPIAYANDVLRTVEYERFYPTFIVGHSMGVRTAVACAHLRPDWVRGLILVDLGFTGAAGGGLGEGLASFLEKLPAAFASRAEAQAFMSAECPDPAIAQYLMAVATVHSVGRATLEFPFDHADLIATIGAASSTSVRDWVREACVEHHIPVLTLRGERSLVWSHAEFVAERAAFADLPGIAFEEVSGAGHGLPFEQRTEFLARVRRFVVEHSVSRQ